MSVERVIQRPAEVRSVPVLNDPDVGHYPEFRDFLVNVFDLQEDPLGAPGLLSVSGRIYELIFAGRSGQPFPAAIEISALVPGLEPMDTDQTDISPLPDDALRQLPQGVDQSPRDKLPPGWLGRSGLLRSPRPVGPQQH